MKEKLAIVGSIPLIVLLLELKKALEATALIPLTSEGMTVAAQGGDITPYLVGMIGVLIAIALPLGLINALSDI